MTTFIAFLRGINVGAHNRMKMTELRALFESLGYENVETYIQSGNVVFNTTKANEQELREEIHEAIETEFGYDISVMIRTQSELAQVVDEQPFDGPDENGVTHYVAFLHEKPTDPQVEMVLGEQNEAESFVVDGRVVYSEIDKNALGDGRFTDVGGSLGMDTTRRNWKVVTAVLTLGE